MTDDDSLLPSAVPWSPVAGVVFLIFFLAAPVIGSFAAHFGGRFWGLGTYLLLPNGLILLSICVFLRIRTGSFRRAERLGALKWVSVGRLVKAGAVPAALSAAAVAGWLIAHAQLRDMLGYSIAEQPWIQLLREHEAFFEGYDLYALLFVMVMLVPVVEELIFRMLLYFPLRRIIGVTGAAAALSFLFAVLHIYPAGSGLEHVINALMVTGQLFIISIFFTALLERTGSLVAPIIGHALYNGAVVMLVFLVVRLEGGQ